MKEWAKKFGFSPSEVRKYFDEWANSDTTRNSIAWPKNRIAGILSKNLSEAAVNFEKAALNDESV